LTEGLQVIEAEVVTREVKHGVQESTAVTVGKNETIAVRLKKERGEEERRAESKMSERISKTKQDKKRVKEAIRTNLGFLGLKRMYFLNRV
jgi:preprotein translocase subunit SecF